MSSEIVMSNIAIWRQKARDNTLTVEEMREAIAAIRKERGNATVVSATSKVKKEAAEAKKAPINSDALLDDLMKKL